MLKVIGTEVQKDGNHVMMVNKTTHFNMKVKPKKKAILRVPM